MSGYYPAGAENDPNAPYNQPEPEKYVIERSMCVILSKPKIELELTEALYDSEEIEDEYRQQHYTLSEILNEYLGIITERRDELKKLKPTPEVRRELKQLNLKIADASGWSEEIEID